MVKRAFLFPSATVNMGVIALCTCLALLFYVGATGYKCGENKCICSGIQRVYIMCRNRDMRKFPNFRLSVKDKAMELYLINSGVRALDLNSVSWPALRKVLLKNNRNLACRDISKLQQDRSELDITSSCRETRSETSVSPTQMQLIGLYSTGTSAPSRVTTSVSPPVSPTQIQPVGLYSTGTSESFSTPTTVAAPSTKVEYLTFLGISVTLSCVVIIFGLIAFILYRRLRQVPAAGFDVETPSSEER